MAFKEIALALSVASLGACATMPDRSIAPPLPFNPQVVSPNTPGVAPYDINAGYRARVVGAIPALYPVRCEEDGIYLDRVVPVLRTENGEQVMRAETRTFFLSVQNIGVVNAENLRDRYVYVSQTGAVPNMDLVRPFFVPEPNTGVIPTHQCNRRLRPGNW